jgi:hypothetical protein
VEEDGAVVGEVDLVEVVHVELADEGGVAVVAVVAGEDDLLQLLLVQDADALELAVPIDDLAVLFGLARGQCTRRMLHSLPINDAGLSSLLGISNIYFGRIELLINTHSTILVQASPVSF